MAHLQVTKQKVSIESQGNIPDLGDHGERLHPQIQGAKADITAFADFEGFEQNTDEKKAALKKKDAYNRIIYQYLQEEHNSCISNFSREKKELKVNSGKSLKQTKKLDVLNNTHRLSKKEKLQLWELRDQYASEKIDFVDDHIQWFSDTLNMYKYFFPTKIKGKAQSYMEFVEIVEAEVSANAAMFLNMHDHSLTTSYLYVTLPNSFKKRITKSHLERLLKKSHLFFYDQSHEVWEPISVLQQQSNASEMHHSVQWLGILDLRKTWAMKGSHSHGEDVRIECVKSVLSENSQMTVNEIAEIICSYVGIPMCIEVTSLIHHMLQTSKNFRRCEDQGMEQAEVRKFKRSLIKGPTLVTTVREKSKSFLNWASVVTKYAQNEPKESVRCPRHTSVETERNQDRKNNKEPPQLIASESLRTTNHCAPTIATVAVPVVSQNEKISDIKIKHKGLITNTEEKGYNIVVSSPSVKISGSDQIETNSYPCKYDLGKEPLKDKVKIYLSTEVATTLDIGRSEESLVSSHCQKSRISETNNMLNKTHYVCSLSSDTQDWKADTNEVDIHCNANIVNNAKLVQCYQAEALENSTRPLRNIFCKTLKNIRPYQAGKSFSISASENQRGSSFRKNITVIMPISHPHPSQSQVTPYKLKAKLLNNGNLLLLQNSTNTGNKFKCISFPVPPSASDVKQVKENTGLSLLVNKDSRNTYVRTNIMIPMTGTDSGSRQGNTGKSTPVAIECPRNTPENSLSAHVSVRDLESTQENYGMSVEASSKTMLKNPETRKEQNTDVSAQTTSLDSRNLSGTISCVPITTEGSTNIQEHTDLSLPLNVTNARNMQKNSGTSLLANQRDSKSIQENIITTIPTTKVDSHSIQKTVDITKVDSKCIQEDSGIAPHETQRDKRYSQKNTSLILGTEVISREIQENTDISIPSLYDQRHIKETADISIPSALDQRHTQENAGTAPLFEENLRNAKKNLSISLSMTEGNSKYIQESDGPFTSVAEADPGNNKVDMSKSLLVPRGYVKNTQKNAGKLVPMVESDLRNMKENTNITSSITLTSSEDIKKNVFVSVDHAYSRNVWKENGACADITQEGSRCTKKKLDSAYSVDHTYSRNKQDDANRSKFGNLSDLRKYLDNCKEQMVSGKHNSAVVSSKRQYLGNSRRMQCCNEHEPKKKRRFDPEALERYRLPLVNGWIREVVTRSSSSKLEPERDVYYHSPLGKKLRSSVETENYLEVIKEEYLTIDNFTYKKNLLGFGEPYEVSRSAKIRYSLDLKVTRPRRRGLCRNINRTSNIPTTSYEEIPSSVFPDDGYWVTSFFDTKNDMATDKVDIVNEVGEVTGYEEWINLHSLNKNSIEPTKEAVRYTENHDMLTSLQHKTELLDACMMNGSFAESVGSSKISHMDFDDMDVDVEVVSNYGDDTESDPKVVSDFLGTGFEIDQSETSENQRKEQEHLELVPERKPLLYIDSKRNQAKQIIRTYKGAKVSSSKNNAKDIRPCMEFLPHLGKEGEYCSSKLVTSRSPSRLGLGASSIESQKEEFDETEISAFPMELNHFQENFTVRHSNVHESNEMLRQPTESSRLKSSANKRKVQCNETKLNTQIYDTDYFKSEFINYTPDVVDPQNIQEQNHSFNICKMREFSYNSLVSTQLKYCLGQCKCAKKDCPGNSFPVSEISKRNTELYHNNGTLPVVAHTRDESHIQEDLKPNIQEISIQNPLICNKLAVNEKNFENVNDFTFDIPELKVEIQSESATESSSSLPEFNEDTVFQDLSNVDHRSNDYVSEDDFISSQRLKPRFNAANNTNSQISERDLPLSYGTVVFSDKYALCTARKFERKSINENLITSECLRDGLVDYPEKVEKCRAFIMPTQNGAAVPHEECNDTSSQQSIPSYNPVNIIQNPKIAVQYLPTYTPVSQQHNLQSKRHNFTMSKYRTNAIPLKKMSAFDSHMHTLHKSFSKGGMDSVSLQNMVTLSRCMDSLPTKYINSSDCLDSSCLQNMGTSNEYIDARPPENHVISNDCMETTSQTVPVFNGSLLSSSHQSMSFSKGYMHSTGNNTNEIECVSSQNMPVSRCSSHILPQKNKRGFIANIDSMTKKGIAVSTSYTNTIPQRNIVVSSNCMGNIPQPFTALSSTCMSSTLLQNTFVSNSHSYTNAAQKMGNADGKVNVISMQNTMVSYGDFNPFQNTDIPVSTMGLAPQNVPVSGSRNTVPWKSMGVTNGYMNTTGHSTSMASSYGCKDRISLKNMPSSYVSMNTIPQNHTALSAGCTNTIPNKNIIPQKNTVSTSDFMNTVPLLRTAVPSGYMENLPQKNTTVSNSPFHTNPVSRVCMSDTSVTTIPIQNTVLPGTDVNAHPLKVKKTSYMPLPVGQDNILPFRNKPLPSEQDKTLCTQNTTLRQQIHKRAHQMQSQNKPFKLYSIRR